MKKTLLDYYKRSGKETVETIDWLFNQLEFPIPNKGEMLHRKDSAILCETFGFVIKITDPKNTPHFRTPHLLRPLASFKAGKLRIDINQAGKLATGEDTYIIQNKLLRAGINSLDVAGRGIDSENGGNSIRLTVKTKDFPNGFPVTFDPSHLESTNPNIGTVEEYFLTAGIYDLRPQPNQIPDIQDKNFGYLRDIFAKSCGHNNTTFDRIRSFIRKNGDLDRKYVRHFLKACAQAVQDKKIVPAWVDFKNNPHYQLRDICEISRCYAQQLRKQNPIAQNLTR